MFVKGPKSSQQRQLFVTMSMQRSGSTWLTDLLNSHKNITAYTELFLKLGQGAPDWGAYRDIPYWNTYRDESQHVFRPAGISAYLNMVHSQHPESKAIGYKLMYSQFVRYPEILIYLVRKNAAIVHLQRRNTLDVVLSGMAKANRKVAHVTSGTAVEKVKLQVDVPLLKTQITKYERRKKYFGMVLSHLGLRYIDVYYEDLVKNADSANELLGFLGVEEINLCSDLVKLNPALHSATIANCREVEKAFVGTPYRGYLRL
ncbi:MAG: LPS sulfotransferase NodH [Porticoccaceae bacterium]|jgi:LPS sulfotransferase NodH